VDEQPKWSRRKKDKAPRGVYQRRKGGDPVHMWDRLRQPAQGTDRPRQERRYPGLP
jgi:hypothetical protein